MVSVFLIGFSIFGFILILYGYGNCISWNKGIKGENIVAEYLNLLPEDYIVFNDVKFQGSWGNLDRVVCGSKWSFCD